MANRPVMFIIAGPNGAGKSTLYATRIKPVLKNMEFVNADQIQKTVLEDPSMVASYKAAAMAGERRKALIAQRKSFITESTFSHPSKLDVLDRAKHQGFRTVVYHVNVDWPSISVNRVAARVAQGGHDVPKEKITQRFERNKELIRTAAMRADQAVVYDNSKLGAAPRVLFTMRDGKVNGIGDPASSTPENMPRWARDLYRRELAPFSEARLNPAAASFKNALAIARNQAGDQSRVYVAGKGPATLQGAVVGETTHHYLQFAGRNEKSNVAEFVTHPKGRIAQKLTIGTHARIVYRSGRSKAQVTVAENAEALQNKLQGKER